MINIALIGASGKMGVHITKLISQKPQLYKLALAVVNQLAIVNELVKQTAEVVSTDHTLSKDIDVVIDFSSPTSNMLTLKQCLHNQIPLVVGTTGFSQSEINSITEASKHIPILMSPNMSLGVNMIFKLTELVAKKLPTFETEIIEAHHRYKKDAPSGTAIKLGQIIANARNIDFEQHAKYTRHGVNESRSTQDIGFSVIRGGNITGSHDVLFIDNDEKLTISVEVNNRDSYASGSLTAAVFLAKQKPGLYNMLDILDL